MKGNGVFVVPGDQRRRGYAPVLDAEQYLVTCLHKVGVALLGGLPQVVSQETVRVPFS